jgi:hypothetical protein
MVRFIQSSSCSIEGCNGIVKARKLCQAHYKRLLKYGDPLARVQATRDLTFAQRLEDYIVDQNGCHLYRGRKTYGFVACSGKPILAHRAVWEYAHGPLAPDVVVRHKCDVPGCINILHLETGTQQDNLDDMRIRGRAVYTHGEKSGTARVTEQQVLVIRQDTRSMRVIAKEYCVSPTCIRNIKRGLTWAYLNA